MDNSFILARRASNFEVEVLAAIIALDSWFCSVIIAVLLLDNRVNVLCFECDDDGRPVILNVEEGSRD